MSDEAKRERKKEVMEKLKETLTGLKKPKNILLVGDIGAGKSSFINSVIMALTGKYDYYADVGGGDRHKTTNINRFACHTNIRNIMQNRDPWAASKQFRLTKALIILVLCLMKKKLKN